MAGNRNCPTVRNRSEWKNMEGKGLLFDILRKSVFEVDKLEAWVGIEPTNKGFADPCLTTWLPRPVFSEV